MAYGQKGFENRILLGMTYISMFPVCLVHCPVDRSIVQQRRELLVHAHTRENDRPGDALRERGGGDGSNYQCVSM